VQLNREQMISIGALILLLLVCVIGVAAALQVRSDAVQELAERRDIVLRLGARSLSATEADGRTKAPSAAFLDAPTAGMATAQLQVYLSQVTSRQNAILISFGVEPARRDDSPDSIRVQATLDVSQKALHELLYQLESGTPYVFVDSLTAQPASTSGPGTAGDPILRLMLNLRALWQRGSA
jgi:general secretion pathway protein M